MARLQGPPADPAAGEQTSAAEADGDKAAKKKAKKGGPAGPALGKGTAIARSVLEQAAAGGEGAAGVIPLAEGGAGLADGFDVAGAAGRLVAALNPRRPALAKLLEELRTVVEANQV